MDFGISGKTALVGASSQGLGKAVALELAKENAKVAICGRTEASLEQARQEIADATGATIHPVVGDLSTHEGREEILGSTVAALGDIEILVTNSGGPPPGQFEIHADAAWETAFNTLLMSNVGLIRGVLPSMKSRRWGRIVCITSQAVKKPVDNLILSNSVRLSVVGLLLTLARELGPHNITVNSAMPGYTNTKRVESLVEQMPAWAEVTKEIPLQRLAEPEEFSAAVAFLCSARASYITGASLVVDGGWTSLL